MSEPIFNKRWFGATPELLRMRDLEPEDAYWLSHPIFAWNAIEAKAHMALQHRNLDSGAGYVNGKQLAQFMDEVFDSQWRRAPARNGEVLRNQLEALRREIDGGRWVVLGSTGGDLVEWIDDAWQPTGGRWRLKLAGRCATNGDALQAHLERIYWQRRLKEPLVRTPLAAEPFKAEINEPLPGVQVAGPIGDALSVAAHDSAAVVWNAGVGTAEFV
jgi:hypothetical protein